MSEVKGICLFQEAETSDQKRLDGFISANIDKADDLDNLEEREETCRRDRHDAGPAENRCNYADQNLGNQNHQLLLDVEAEISGIVGAFCKKGDDNTDKAERVNGKRKDFVVVNLRLRELSGVVKGIRLRLCAVVSIPTTTACPMHGS